MGWAIEQWIPILTISGSAIAWSISGISRAITYRREQDQREWERLQELIAVLHNGDASQGHWAQLAAVSEMETLASRRPVVLKIAQNAVAFWRAKAPDRPIVQELDGLIARLPKPSH